MKDQRLTFSVSAYGDAVLLDVRGSLDVYTLPKLREALDILSSRNGIRILIALEGLSHIDKAGTDALLKAAKTVEAAAGELMLCGKVEKFFEGRVLDTVKSRMRIFATDQEAMEYLVTAPLPGEEGPLPDRFLNFNSAVIVTPCRHETDSDQGQIKPFRSKIEAFDESRLFLVLPDTLPGHDSPSEIIPEGMECSIALLTPKGILSAGSRSLGLKVTENRRLLCLTRPSAEGRTFERWQERQRIRVLVEYETFETMASRPGVDLLRGVTRDLSCGGMLLEGSAPFKPGELLGLRFRVGPARVEDCIGEVSRVMVEAGPGRSEVIHLAGIRFRALHHADRAAIFDHVISFERLKR